MTARGSQSNGFRTALAAMLLTAIIGGVGCVARSATRSDSVGVSRYRESRPTQVFLARHAEKAAGVPNPSLTAEGRARARALARALADAGLETIYSTEFARTRETAQAVSDATGLEMRIFPVGDQGVEAFTEGMAREILERQQGRTVLVVGHSNTVPPLMRALGATEVADLTEKDYDDLFLVERDGPNRVRLLQLHYGAPSE